MNDAHFHLVFNHFPIIVPIVGMLILIVGFFVDSDVVKRTAFGVFIFGAIMTFPAMFTGEGAEEVAEKLPGITHDIIHEHEEKAEVFAILSYILGLLSIGALWASLKQKSFANILSIAVLLLGLVGFYLGRQVGTSGGEIRHTEIRANAVPAADED
ncbi:MAG: hypothetical protein IPG48_14855 [Saprospiraceae bacterium]|jgi:uncharacterized membrane protein|nr:hypothetical protein [Saprospiraceae bacterium]MBK7697992.1 hypothetical protein [Saprospiraceae bacterium]MBK8825233.1 hypothetical protein [Saprospiraceae bacterium]MBK8888167.1 hypothetical protein [Saprospiraceae bacterium]MBK9580844.1 hypothetical protein [Saprospiraceae bacterium]